MQKLFNKELYFRLFSVLIFVPLVVLPIIYNNYFSVVIYLIFNSIILFELSKIYTKIRKKIIYYLFNILTIFSFFMFLMILLTKDNVKIELIEIIIVIWFFDTFCYLGGKVIGGKKLYPKISQGKTISGLISGIIFTLSTIIFINHFLQIFFIPIFFAVLIIIISFLGDTMVSLLKRNANIKDSGNIMPGHGGLLDRFDSFIAVFLFVGLIYIL